MTNQFKKQPETPKLWRDMTPEEKGALLLAHHERRTIEFCIGGNGDWQPISDPSWGDVHAYRIRPEPKRETVTLYGGEVNTFDWDVFHSHIKNKLRITFDTIDGKPDCASIRMEEL